MITHKTTILMGAVDTPEAVVASVWEDCRLDVTVIPYQGSWQGLPERSLGVVFYGDEDGCEAVEWAVYDIARRYGEQAVLVDRGRCDARMVMLERVEVTA